MSVLLDVHKGLEKAYSRSKRKGKWSTVPNVRRYSDKASLVSLRKLVRQGSATEKKISGIPQKLFKPTRGAAGGGLGQPVDQELGYRAPEGLGDRYPRKDDQPTDGQPRRGSSPTRDVVGAGIATMLVGGLGGSSAASTGGISQTVIR